jgi:ATP-dependent DNA helicase DinG
VVCICDPRLVGKPYAEIFLNSIPNMKKTRDPELVSQFIADIIQDVDISQDVDINQQTTE